MAATRSSSCTRRSALPCGWWKRPSLPYLLPASLLKQSPPKALPQQQQHLTTPIQKANKYNAQKTSSSLASTAPAPPSQWTARQERRLGPCTTSKQPLPLADGCLKLEGEQCCDVASSIGLVAISQPGNKALLKPRANRPSL